MALNCTLVDKDSMFYTSVQGTYFYQVIFGTKFKFSENQSTLRFHYPYWVPSILLSQGIMWKSRILMAMRTLLCMIFYPNHVFYCYRHSAFNRGFLGLRKTELKENWWNIIPTLRQLIWFGLIRLDLIWFDLIWFDLIWFDLIWYDMIWFDLIWFDLIWFDWRDNW